MLNHGLGTHYTWSCRGACYGQLKVCVVSGRVSLNRDPDEFLGPVTEFGLLETDSAKTCMEPSTIPSIAGGTDIGICGLSNKPYPKIHLRW